MQGKLQQGAGMRAHIGLRAAAVAFAFSLGIGAASAGDRYDGLTYPGALPYNWSGIYFGGHAGGEHTAIAWTFTNPTETMDQSHLGFIGGVQGGAQWQWSSVVLGAEVSYRWANIEETSGSILQPGFSLTSEVRNLLLVTGKVGVAWENLLAYAKGGWASGDVDFRSSVTATGVLATSSSGRENGWIAGVGLDYALTQHISIGVEYDYVRLNADPRDQIPGPAGVAGSQAVNGGIDIQTVMARLNFKFGPRPAEFVPVK
jgi:outer membrane immunogenic protein